MKFKDLETTYICQLGKNRKMLEAYKARRDKSGKELANYYADIIDCLVGTPAWNVSGVNKMLNELTSNVRATLNKAKRGKTSAYAHATKMLNMIDYYANKTATAYFNGNYKLQELLTAEELIELCTIE